MRSKIIFLLLFMFSFVIAHDTVIEVLDKEKHPLTLSVSSKASSVTQTASPDVNSLHAMFHFVALVSPNVVHMVISIKTKRVFYSLEKPSLLLEETSYKPPIV